MGRSVMRQKKRLTRVYLESDHRSWVASVGPGERHNRGWVIAHIGLVC